jgi:hypothetical protein
MKRSNVNYSELDKVLRSLGFTCRPAKNEPPGVVYEHQKSGAIIMLPTYGESDKVFEHHLVAARIELDNFGLADPSVFAAKLQKAG